MPPQSYSTLLPPTVSRLDQLQLYRTGFNNQVNSVNATLTIDHKCKDQSKVQHWAILIHTGAMTSVASNEHFPQIPLKQLRAEDPQKLTAVNGEQVTIYRIKQFTIVYNNLAVPLAFIISDINCAIMGLDAIMKNGLCLTVDGYRGYLGSDRTEVKLDYIGNHFYLEARVFDGLYSYVDYMKDFASWYCD
eukprot:2510690-Amphidinium_carterae.1